MQSFNYSSAIDLMSTSITNNSINDIVKYLKSTLEELDVSKTNIDFSKLVELKSLPKLRVLRCFLKKSEEMESLKLQLPFVNINREYLKIADSEDSDDSDMIWDIKAKQLEIF